MKTTILDELYVLKKHILMLEGLTGNNDKAREMYEEHLGIYPMPETERELLAFTKALDTRIKAGIPADVREEWEYSDYEVYTDKAHHRKFWNEIENEKIVSEIFKKFTEIKGLVWDESSEYFIELYDFNNEALYFLSEEKMRAFINEYGPQPYTAFRTKDGFAAELWSE